VKKIVRMSIFIEVLVYVIAMPLFSFAAWEGPWKVVKGHWGSGADEFYFSPNDSTNTFPRQFVVAKNGDIIIADKGNRRIAIYKSDGTLKKIIKKPSALAKEDAIYGWPPYLDKYSKDNLFVISCEYERVPRGIRPLKKCIIDENGNIKAKIKMGRVFVTVKGFLVMNNGNYYYYSPNGQLTEMYKEKPWELGIVREQSLGGGRYKVTVKYPEKEWIIIGKGACEEYTRIGNCELYCVGDKQIAQYDSEGHEQGRLTVPENIEKQISRGSGVEPRIEVLEEYGSPIIAPNGDVYVWKRTNENYEIIKWVWTNGPDAPIALAVSSSKDGLIVNWQVPAKNFEDIQGYEVARSTNICGPFKTIGSMAKGVMQFEDKKIESNIKYYYQIRSIRKYGYSGYSNKALGYKK
jgi:hypothetical protein